MHQDIRFCTAPDGVRLAYATSGAGYPLVKAPNWLNHLEYDWDSPIWRHLFRELSRDHLLVRFDERGNGLSDWDAADVSFQTWITDLETVVDDLKLDRFALLGISQGGAVGVEYAIRHPERVSHLIMLGAFARGWAKRGTRGSETREAMLTLMREGWGATTRRSARCGRRCSSRRARSSISAGSTSSNAGRRRRTMRSG